MDSGGQGTRPARNLLRGIDILVVDDNVDAQVIFNDLLAYAGASVHIADSAGAAVRTLLRIIPSVVLTDVSMPHRDGMWLLRWIRYRDAKRHTHLPVIAVSARDQIEWESDIVTGFDAYLVKPVDPRELFAAIARVVRRPLVARSA